MELDIDKLEVIAAKYDLLLCDGMINLANDVVNDTKPKTIIEKLNVAQDLLSDVYHWLQENDLDDRGMSMADTCIVETLELVKESDNAVC